MIQQRAFTRNRYKASIKLAMSGSEECIPAKMINSSVGGMCVETLEPLKPGSSVFIKLEEIAPDPYWPEACTSYLAEVRWCEENTNGKSRETDTRYGIGLRFIVEPCKRCGEFFEQKDLKISDLCPECQEQLDNISDGAIREGIRNYLSGNIL